MLEVSLAGPAWIFLVVLSALTGLLGLIPAWQATRTDLVSSLRRKSAQSGGPTGKRLRTTMAIVQIALATTLLITAGLFTRSLQNLYRVDLGIAVDSLATFGISPELNRYTPDESRALFRRIEEELTAFPGVRSVTASMVPLISGSNWGSNVTVQGFTTDPDADTNASYNEIGPGYFSTLGVPLIAGREFTDADVDGSPKVAIVNEAFARKFEIASGAVGKRMEVGSGGELDIEIVGLVQNAKYSEVKGEVPPQFFLPYRQNEELGFNNFYVRAEAAPDDLLPAIRELVSGLDPNLPIDSLQTMSLQVESNVSLERMMSTLSVAFAGLATLLAAIGLYGVVAYNVTRQRREIGLRMALGADTLQVRRMVMREVAVMAVPGAVLGVGAALGIGRLARSLLFELQPHDPGVLGLAVGLLVVVALGAGLIPAQRAARIDPMLALREE